MNKWLNSSGVLPRGRELSRLLNAAVVSRDFRDLLLTNPAAALATGYYGDAFYLTPEERGVILSIHASSLTDFATQLVESQLSGRLSIAAI